MPRLLRLKHGWRKEQDASRLSRIGEQVETGRSTPQPVLADGLRELDCSASHLCFIGTGNGWPERASLRLSLSLNSVLGPQGWEESESRHVHICNDRFLSWRVGVVESARVLPLMLETERWIGGVPCIYSAQKPQALDMQRSIHTVLMNRR